MPTYFIACFIIIVVIIIVVVLIRRIGDSGKSVWVEDFSGLFKKKLYCPVERSEEKSVCKRGWTNEMCTRVRERMTVNKLNNESTHFIVIQLSSKFRRTKHYLELEQEIIFSDRIWRLIP